MKKPNTIADFKAKFDPSVVVPNKIRAALAGMLSEGPEHWEYELDFLKRADVSPTQFAQFREMFEKYMLVVRESGKCERRVWFGCAKVAAKVRGD